jgi:hypothetical protein
LENRLYYSYPTLAQVGYLHWDGCPSDASGGLTGNCSDGQAHIFVQWTDNAGIYSTLYYFGATSGTETIEVKRVNSSYFNFFWNGSSYSSASVSWGPDSEVTKTEVHDYSSPSAGSQTVGDTGTNVSVSGAYYVDQNSVTHNTNYSYGSKSNPTFLNSTAYQALSSSDASDFNVWDSRC